MTTNSNSNVKVKDWTGNKKSAFSCIGASNHSSGEREKNDYYATEPKAVDVLIKDGGETFNKQILEPACGEGHMAERLKHYGYEVISFDIVDRSYGGVQDFFSLDTWHSDIITNPPYKIAKEFIEHSLKIIPDGNKVAMFLKLTFLEGKARKEFFKEYPPKCLYVSSSRLQCAKNGEFEKHSGNAVAYGWYVWVKGFKGHPIIKWIN